MRFVAIVDRLLRSKVTSGQIPQSIMVNTTTSMVVPVDPAHRFDERQLLRYMQEHLPGFPSAPATLQVSQVYSSYVCAFVYWGVVAALSLQSMLDESDDATRL